MGNFLYCIGRTVRTGLIMGYLSVPCFVADTSISLKDEEMEEGRSLIGAPFPTPITDYVLPISLGIGGLVGLVRGIREAEDKRKRSSHSSQKLRPRISECQR